MRIYPWHLLLLFGLFLIVVKLLIELLIPIGIVMIIIALIMAITNRPRPFVKQIDQK